MRGELPPLLAVARIRRPGSQPRRVYPRAVFPLVMRRHLTRRNGWMLHEARMHGVGWERPSGGPAEGWQMWSRECANIPWGRTGHRSLGIANAGRGRGGGWRGRRGAGCARDNAGCAKGPRRTVCGSGDAASVRESAGRCPSFPIMALDHGMDGKGRWSAMMEQCTGSLRSLEIGSDSAM
jgi:hypothetical protein